MTGPVPAPALARVAAFTTDPAAGNPAGVWVGAALPDDAAMQRIAAEVGYSETAFVAPADGPARVVRYYSPEAEVPFCGHATIAAGFVLGETGGDGTYRLATAVGEVPVVVRTRDGAREASLTSVAPAHERAPAALVDAALAALGWAPDDLDPAIPPARAFAGAWHLVLAARTADRLARLAYDFAALRALMLADGLTTLQLVWREGPHAFVSRNPFPVGGVVEDPATGAAAAALGGYLRDAGLLAAPATLVVRQGDAMGRPSRIVVDVPAAGGVVVTGRAVRMPEPVPPNDAGDRYLGTWELVPELSLYEAGAPPASGRYTIAEPAPGVLALRVRWQAEPGGPAHESAFGGPADGTPQPLPARPADGGAAAAAAAAPDALTLTRVDAHTLDSAALARGRVVASARRVASRDGALLAVVQEQVDAAGRRTRNFQLYRRAPDTAAAPGGAPRAP